MENIKLYRKSSYVIPICVNDVQKQYMLIHGFTGALDIVSEDIASMFLQDNINSPLPEHLSEKAFQLLEKRGYITLKPETEEHLIANKIAAAIHAFQRRNRKRFYFIVNYNCNFRCSYCYEKER